MKKFILAFLIILGSLNSLSADTIMDQDLATPVLTDQVWGIDDPSGSPAECRFTIQSIADLLWTDLVAGDIPDLSATYELQLVNEAGLYSVLSDVSDFVQTSEINSAANLETIANLGAFFSDYADDADAATMRATLGLVIGTNVLAPNGSGSSLTDIPLDSDFSSNGLMERTASGVYGIATAGTDYVAPGGVLGTPSSGTLTNCTGLPIGGLPTAAVTNGDDTHVATCDAIYDFCETTQGYLTAEVDGSVSNELPTEGTYTDVSGTQVSVDVTEITGAVSFNDGSTDASQTWTWDLTAGDPSISFESGKVRFNDDVDIGNDDEIEYFRIHDGGTITMYDDSDDIFVILGPVLDGTTTLRITGSLDLNGGTVQGSKKHLTIIDSSDADDAYTVVIADYDGIVCNAGDDDTLEITLPSAGAGILVTILLAEARDININPATGDQIMVLTDSPGDAISSDATQGSRITLFAVDTTEWFVLESYGTWTDIN